MNTNLEYLADSLIIEALAKDDPMMVIAQEGGVMGSVAKGVKDYVASQFDKTRPIASIAAFLGRGLLWSMGFKWMATLYTVAEALGFDWKEFWSSVGNGITQFAKTIIGSKTKASEDQASSHINNVVQESFENAFTGDVDKDKLLDVARRRKLSEEIRDALELKAIAIRLQSDPKLIKQAGVLSLFKGKLARFFIRTISWLVKTALISLGFVSAAGAVSGLVGHKPGDNAEQKTDTSALNKLQVSPNVPQDMFTVHPNNMSNVWIESGEIQNINGLIKNWILSVYPQFKNKMSSVEGSSSFQSMINKFRDRNRLASGLGMISVPRPYQRKADVVATIISGFLQESPQEPEQQQNNTKYL